MWDQTVTFNHFILKQTSFKIIFRSVGFSPFIYLFIYISFCTLVLKQLIISLHFKKETPTHVISYYLPRTFNNFEIFKLIHKVISTRKNLKFVSFLIAFKICMSLFIFLLNAKCIELLYDYLLFYEDLKKRKERKNLFREVGHMAKVGLKCQS